MKTKNILLVINTILFSILFYQQNIGINVFIFNTVITISLLIINSEKAKTTSNYLLIAAAIVSSISCLLYGNLLSILAYVISIIVLTASINEKRLSIPILFLTGFISIFVSIIEKLSQPKKPRKTTKNIDPILILFVTGVFLLFLMIYGFSNPNFKKLLLKINLEFLSFHWIAFISISFYLLYGIINWFGEKDIISNDRNQSTKLPADVKYNSTLFSSIDFLKSGVLLFVLLNLLLLVVNLTDIYHYFFEVNKNNEVNHSSSLHQSIISLITSIVIAISLMLIYFKGYLNFIKNKWLIYLASFWVFQNIILALISGYKNQIYINEYGLTFKRIGVYMYITLTLVGLIITYIKVNKKKSNWYLFKNMGAVFFVFIIAISTVNWSNVIINYNVNRYKKTNDIDWYYLISLYEEGLPKLIEIDKKGIIKDEKLRKTFHNRLGYKIKYLKEEQDNSWQSWNYTKSNINESVNKFINK